MNNIIKLFSVGILILLLGVWLYPRTVSGTVSRVYWKTTVNVEEYRRVHVSDSSSRPPSDAYNVSEDKQCSYNPSLKYVTCDTDYSWDMDRWVVVRHDKLEGEDRSPVFPAPEIKHVETGYGNQRTKSHLNFFISSDVGTCEISRSRWEKVKIGDSFTTKKVGFWTLCTLSFED